MSDEIETLAPNVEETPPVEDERVVVPMDCDPTGWKLSEQMAYRAAVGCSGVIITESTTRSLRLPQQERKRPCCVSISGGIR